MNIFDHYRQRYEAAKDEEFTLQEFLTTCRQDRSAYANAAERLLMAIGEPVMVDTAQEPRLSRLFSNRVIARYPAFEEFYGMEDAIEQIVSYLKHAAQGLEEKKQILYLLYPVQPGIKSFTVIAVLVLPNIKTQLIICAKPFLNFHNRLPFSISCCSVFNYSLYIVFFYLYGIYRSNTAASANHTHFFQNLVKMDWTIFSHFG